MIFCMNARDLFNTVFLSYFVSCKTGKWYTVAICLSFAFQTVICNVYVLNGIMSKSFQLVGCSHILMLCIDFGEIGI